MSPSINAAMVIKHSSYNKTKNGEIRFASLAVSYIPRHIFANLATLQSYFTTNK